MSKYRSESTEWDSKQVSRFINIVVVHHFELGRIIRFQAAVSDISGGKHPESSHQLIVKSRCLRHYSNTDKTSVWYIRSLDGVECQALVAPYPF